MTPQGNTHAHTSADPTHAHTQIMCISLLVHVSSKESFRLVDVKDQDTQEEAAQQAEEFDHLLLFEARVRWEDLVHYSQVILTHCPCLHTDNVDHAMMCHFSRNVCLD
jgi:hypothetical protein